MKSPGPGTYNFMVADKSLRINLSAKIGTSTRDSEQKAKQRVCNVPSPNTYNPSFSASKRSEPSFGFGTSVRQPLAPKKNTPGPQYSVPGKIVEGPSFQMGSKCEGQSYVATEQKKTIANPGPGSYAPQFYKTIHQNGSYSIKGRYTLRQALQVPGPGAYTIDASPGKQSTPSVHFGSASQREPLKPSCAPGPGSYHIPSSMANLPGYTGAGSKQFAYI